MRMYLTGFMGTGKSSMGLYVAEALQIPFIDTDTQIEIQSGISVTGIFETLGEQEFRALESDILRQTTIHEKALIATGGGLPCHHDNMQWMNDHGITVWLSWPREKLKSNLFRYRYERPLLSRLNDEELDFTIDMLLHERMPYYQMAAMTVELLGEFERDTLLLQKACTYIW